MPKFKTGYTVTKFGNDSQCIIIGTNDQIAPYTDYYLQCEQYDDSDESHTIYFVYSVETRIHTWIWERGFEHIPYCTNEDRGRRILKGNEDTILSIIHVRRADKERFIKDFLNSTSFNENEKTLLSPITPSPTEKLQSVITFPIEYYE